MRFIRHAVLLFMVVITVPSPLLRAQRDTWEPTPVPLQEQDKVKVPSLYSANPPWHCDLDGRLYSRNRSLTGPRVVRFNRDQLPERTLPADTFLDPLFKDYQISDYAPDHGGGIFAIAVKRDRKGIQGITTSMFRFDQDGSLGGVVPIADLIPVKVAVFLDGNLLVMGKSTVRDSVATSTPWFTGIFRPDGVLLKKVSLDPTAISFGAEKALAGLDSEDTINEALKFFPSRNGRIYAALETSEVLPSFGHEARLVEVAPSGEVRFYKLHGAKKSELFRVVVGVGRVFAVFGDRDGFKDDLREFQINESSGTLDLVGRYKVLGGPECVSDDGLLVIRPDGKGGKYLVTYKR